MSANRYAGVDPTAWAALDDKRDDRWRCRSCNRREAGVGRFKPANWYQLTLSGDYDPGRDALPGVYCSLDCLAVAVLHPFGLSEQQVRAWLSAG